jgi:NAD(P)-dependent dehydrogenase (short-subunit alcohol dehydrogenase family)
MSDTSRGWALILGSSSGFGAACSRALAKAGYNIFGVHLDRKHTMPQVQAVMDDIAAAGRQVKFFNKNVASDENRLEILCEIAQTLTGKPVELDAGLSFADPNHHDAILTKIGEAVKGHEAAIRAMLHSVAFGALNPFIDEDPKKQMTRRQLDMTLDVMANSLVYWCQDLARINLIGQGSKIFSMTSAGSHRVIWGYGPVSAAKAALESHTRQLALELGPRGVRVNCFEAGVTDTPALRMIPGSDVLKSEALRRNPGGRLTTPEDIANTFVALMDSNVQWINGTVIKVDCGEDNI